jgi:XTP/dITP diphosphohydrolase
MELILASGNRGKLKEFEKLLGYPIKPYKELVGDIEIVEDGQTFKDNALIKASKIYKIVGKDYIVISDDSGICVDALDGKPGIYSARFAGENASDIENLDKLIDSLKKMQLDSSKAHYCAAIAIVSKYGEYVVHGWMHGKVIAQKRGTKGFGYDPCFIPEGFKETLGELDDSIKKEISHRSKALNLAMPIINLLQKKGLNE